MTEINRLEIVNALMDSVQPEIDSIRTADDELYRRKVKIATLVAEAIGKLPEYEKVTNDAEDEHEEISEILGEFAGNLGFIWSGHYDYDGWEMGDRPRFWLPSTQVC